ncbi:MAG: putative sugar O-methyltransferase [Chlamydiia bacterium]|jgi:hypothetical protein
MKKLCFLLLAPFLVLWGQRSSVSDMDSYKSVCQRAISDPQMFQQFKRCPGYTDILEHVDFHTGKEYLAIACRQSPELEPYFFKTKINDVIGSPNVFLYDNYGYFSPTTLRYLKVASDLSTFFGSLEGKNIIEIGGGYGGQCLVISSLFKIKKYTVVDLKEPLGLSKKYLDCHGISNVEFLTPEEIDKALSDYDIVISNYAFSEIVSNWQMKYAEKVLKNCTKGYLTCNSDSFLSVGVLSISQLELLFTSMGLPFQKLPEKPCTGSGNVIFTWDKNRE